MRSKAPALLPVFRTRTQGEILALVLLEPEREWTVSELAGSTGAPLTSVQSEVARLASGSLVTTRKIGRTRLIRANIDNPVVAPLTQVVLLTFGPKPVIAEEFANVGAQRVLIFGSWAARLSGETGAAPADIDVLVVGDEVVRADLYAAAERAEARLGRPVNPVLRSTLNWANPENDPLLGEVIQRPMVDVTASPTPLVSA